MKSMFGFSSQAAVVCGIALGWGCFAASYTAEARAASEVSSQPPAFANSVASEAKEYEGFRSQPGDDVAQPLEPSRERTTAEEKRLNALAWYMKGELLQSRGDFIGAYEAFGKGAEEDPRSAAIRKALVPLAFALNKNDEAIQHALKAIELDPTDHRMLRRLGLQLASQGKMKQAVELLRKAAESPRLSKKSSTYVLMMRELGVLHSALGQTEEAADAFDTMLDALLDPGAYELDERTLDQLNADNASTYELIGKVLLEAGRYGRSIKAYERAAKLGNWSGPALGFHLAEILQRQGKPQEALSELQKYFDAELQSKGRAPYELLAKILAEQKKSDELIPRLEALAKKDSHNAKLQFFLGDQYLAANRLDAAEGQFRAGLKGTTDTEGHLGLAAIHRLRNEPAELLEQLTLAVQGTRGSDRADDRLAEEFEAITKNEKLVDALIATGRKRVAADDGKWDVAQCLLLAKFASDAGENVAAAEFFRYAIPEVTGQRRIAAYSELGDALFAAERYDDAAAAFREASRDGTLIAARPEFLLRLAQSSELAGETDAALKAIREARKIIPDNSLLHYQEGWIHYHAKQWDEAIRVFREVVRDYPDDAEILKRAWFSISNIHVEKGEFEQGEAILEKYLKENPDDPGVNNDLGYLWADHDKNLERAEGMIRKALASEPDNAAYLDSMGWVLYRLGRYAEAVEHLEKAVSNPTGADATILDHLGDAYEKLGKNEKSREAWKKALEDARDTSRPDDELIDRLEKKLRGKGTIETPSSP